MSTGNIGRLQSEKVMLFTGSGLGITMNICASLIFYAEADARKCGLPIRCLRRWAGHFGAGDALRADRSPAAGERRTRDQSERS